MQTCACESLQTTLLRLTFADALAKVYNPGLVVYLAKLGNNF